MPSGCTWTTQNGAHCPFPATSTGNTWGPGRWLCDHHVECPDGRTGDMIVFDEINRRKAASKAADESVEDNEARATRLAAAALERSMVRGEKLYSEGMAKAKAKGVEAADHHRYACAHMVNTLSRPDLLAGVAAA